jgi:hypothetical protein
MRLRVLLSVLLLAAFAGPAVAQDSQQRGGVSTETMSRMAGGSDNQLLWNIVGLIGLLGLIGLRSEHPDDSYHPAAVE